MKKNLLGALVICFVLFACLLVINEVMQSQAAESENDTYYIAD
ncbi:hypothetical protein Q4509_02090 [Oceanihabitans sp. 1_MG-2023]|nr:MULTISPECIES: hypothetical protein [Flavobacteriaceae]MDO6621634.1 hypothetical protein [Oceanihabitans sp. 1_MG-2023]